MDEARGLDMTQPGPLVCGWRVMIADDGERWWLLVRPDEDVADVLRDLEIGEAAGGEGATLRPWTMHEYMHATVSVEGEDRRIPLREAAEEHARDLASGSVSSRCFAATCV